MPCKTCIYWRRDGWPDDLYGCCTRTSTKKGVVEDETTLAWVKANDNYAYLNTHETFDCKQCIEAN